jgi:hypothetical protein
MQLLDLVGLGRKTEVGKSLLVGRMPLKIFKKRTINCRGYMLQLLEE